MSFWTARHSGRPNGFRAGIVIGLAFALVGVAVGTATGAVTPFQQVLVVNAPASPIPVAGTVNIGNAPANQAVTVSNFPATQAVTVSNLPATQDVDGEVRIKDVRVWNGSAVWPNSEGHDFTFNTTLHVTGVTLSDILGSDTMSLYFITTNSGRIQIHNTGAGFSRDFTAPFAATGVEVFCNNQYLDCDAELTVFGY